jgi:hypothetical protein
VGCQPLKLIVISFVASLLVGAWLGVGPAESEVPLQPEPASRMRDDRTVERRWSREDFQSRARDIMGNALTGGNNPSSALLESWADAEIRNALDEALKDPDYVLENGGRGHVMDALFGEWMKRDLDAAIIWFDSVKIETARNRMILNLSYRWPAEHAGRGLEFVISHKELFTRSSPWSILLKNMEASAKDGPDALGKMLGRIADEELALDFGSTAKLPEGFDFSGFVKTEGYLRTKDQAAVTALLSNWMSHDRESAYDWFLANGGPVKLFELKPQDHEMGLDYLEWLGGKLGSLEKPRMDEWFAAAGALFVSDSSAAERFARRIDDPELREKVHEQGARVILSGGIEPALRHLEGIRDPAKRLEILTTMDAVQTPAAFFMRQPVSAEDEETLRQKLREWQASESQIDEVLKKIKP